ncbi:alpha-glucosidase C-terminal domain-containing protein [Hymenobacter sp. BT186]|uniref:Alpha-glucosidase C-terminal domain-containing protein n=1 Tax=Hymenobacter telluris TaxID=2816474 RepID=A0A939EX84_9BACT|nr:alpha-amylase family glycosyl hydrolase [Hymenobacter telluris]MBO0358847.1 alpha-glucosidase C-terminal domain-containing protein [Hymenobacter telluris]MBW3374873.1 alpha-glucosidase C-terminal domain-containing protein [Hymenobacter norwichensis]
MLKSCLLLSGLLALLTACNQPHSTTADAQETCGPAAPAAFTIRHPAWAANASIYEVNIRQYTPEGTFRAFEAHLPRLQQMGVGILWLMPVQPIGQRKRKGTLGSQYSIQDYRAVNPEFGTMADLRHLVDAAHQRGMHVILDWVANHTSWDSQLVQQHPNWFTKGKQGQFVPPVSDWQDVIDLDYSKPELRRYMTESMTFWLREAGFDGFRCDVAGLVPTDFWNSTRPELEKVKPVFMLAEWDELHDPPFLKKGEFDPNTGLLEKAFDATYGLRLRYLLDSISRGQQPTAAINRYLEVERAKYPATSYLMYFTSSHDINSWDGTEYERLGKDALPQAVLTALLPGIPMVYSGQEAALKKRLRFFDKDTIPWNDYPLQEFYTKLLQLKKSHPALRNGDSCSEFEALPVSTSPDVYAFRRQKDEAAVLVAVNMGDKPHELMMRGLESGTFRELFTGQILRLGETSKMLLTPHSYRVYELVPEQD